MAALLTSERANTDKMVQYIGECREMGIRVLPPDVNQSEMFFTVVAGVTAVTRQRWPRERRAEAPDGFTPAERAGGRGVASAPRIGDHIRFGLAAIKNVGEGAVEAVLAARREGGPFRSLFDFCERVDLQRREPARDRELRQERHASTRPTRGARRCSRRSSARWRAGRSASATASPARRACSAPRGPRWRRRTPERVG